MFAVRSPRNLTGISILVNLVLGTMWVLEWENNAFLRTWYNENLLLVYFAVSGLVLGSMFSIAFRKRLVRSPKVAVDKPGKLVEPVKKSRIREL